jgi:hypothetical protein
LLGDLLPRHIGLQRRKIEGLAGTQHDEGAGAFAEA